MVGVHCVPNSQDHSSPGAAGRTHNRIKGVRVVLKSLTVVIALTFATAASAQGQCQNVSEIHRNLDRIINQVELVPSDEAKYAQ